MGIVTNVIILIIVILITIGFNNRCKEIQKDVDYKEKMKIGFIGFSIVLVMVYIGQFLTSSVLDKYNNVISQNLIDILTALKILFMVGGIQMLLLLIILCKTALIKMHEGTNDSDA